MYFNESERVALFIDAQNLIAAQRALSFEVDYKSLLSFFRSRTRLLRAFFFTLASDDKELSSARRLVDWLEYNGYSIIDKSSRLYIGGSGQKRSRACSLIDVAVESMRIINCVDHYVFLAGDSDLCGLVRTLQGMGKRVMLISTLAASANLVSDELRRGADQFVDLETLAPLIGRWRSHETTCDVGSGSQANSAKKNSD